MMDRPDLNPEAPTTPLQVPWARRRAPVLVGAAATFTAIVIVLLATTVIRGSWGGWDSATPPSDGRGSTLPITVDGDRIVRGGEPWWFLGYNSFVWSGNCGNDDERMSAEDIDDWFSTMRDDGHGAVRLFFFEGWDIERLDAAVESAKRHGLYVTITLDDAIAGCGTNDKDEAWFADQAERDAYEQHMTTLLERYRGESTIAWFEYFNEPDPDLDELRDFYDEMGAAAASVDPDRLFASGTIAPYDSPGSYRNVHESEGVDIASLHEYDENEVESNHGPDALAGAAGKPVIVGEFGLYASPDGGDCERSFTERAEQIRAKAQAYTSGAGYAGALAWAWQPGGDDDCEYGNLDEDTASQDVLRSFSP
ncbi:cellulase family glycosylhydrolase [Pseudonocardia abyssalis]|jgi:endo-1,4-beta-mannosidase|uniref:Cellulase family glycosylhydrolase n=1 Tax=Pseudonocardia abyssalis TaxID=2792008 RepID=A0ABS6US29_9PSEU|nr:cellulase family glycosylhydrolase [Pseudonocardia abyssalis]MBW0114540.1 cellulase family glycosylhydrolase [Pseudonocardia abyssalis]MBW0135061.1 cellulase family glycosylhydrolase [Pseudonocardia abyssalis]